MYDSGKIISGIVIFLALITFPIWYNAASGKGKTVPEPKIVTKKKECVKSKEYMKGYHMQIVDDWRNEVIRDANRTMISISRDKYYKSLTNTCLNCHPNKKDFCDKCHNYLGVSPRCWECHNIPEELKK